jgi:hypothetical protein
MGRMARSKLALLLGIACACGSRTRAPGPPSNTAPGGHACPGADAVVILQWLDASRSEAGAPIAAGWRAFLANRILDEGGGPPYEHITPEDALAAGVAQLPSTIWIYDGDRAPCRGRVTTPFRSIRVEGPTSQQVGVEVAGCDGPASGAPTVRFGLSGDAEPAGCAWTMTHEVATRVGELSDQGGHWSAPTQERPIPTELAPLVAQRACARPVCERLWTVEAAGPIGGELAYDVVQTWLTPDPHADACELKHDDQAEVFVRGPRGLEKLAMGDGANSRLVGVFHDGGGARLVVLEDAGTYDVYSVGAPTTRAIHRDWFGANEEDDNYRSVAPYCGP